jgi:hypothetical protein
MANPNWQALRKIVARRDGYRCRYCGVPTAATIEHIIARSLDGGSRAENLCLACPLCNSIKGDRPVADFLASNRWQLTPPPLPDTLSEMLKDCFSWEHRSGLLATGSANAKLQLRDHTVTLMVRAGAHDDWQLFRLGQADHPRVISASWDFLTRHNTPKRPKRRRPPKAAFRSR